MKIIIVALSFLTVPPQQGGIHDGSNPQNEGCSQNTSQTWASRISLILKFKQEIQGHLV